LPIWICDSHEAVFVDIGQITGGIDPEGVLVLAGKCPVKRTLAIGHIPTENRTVGGGHTGYIAPPPTGQTIHRDICRKLLLHV